MSPPAPSFMAIDSAAQLPSNNGGEGLSAEAPPPPSLAQQQAQAQLTALLNFKPSSRDVISGIAPHVFDDQRPSYRARSRRRLRRTSSPECRRRSMSPAPHSVRSPLRLSAVLSVDDLDSAKAKGEENVVLEVYTAPLSPLGQPPSDSHQHDNKTTKRRGFRIDHVLKTFVFRLK
ncbi:hypothetical protein B0H12DRAFT_681319 [Mycena haematopus]|nr:hypothetical protein B0H12DRAFT_681319 [Mycena haematopus]